MKIVNVIIVSVIVCLFSACVTNYIVWKADDNIKKVELGMTKADVVKVMGDKYMIASASTDDKENRIEIWGYKNAYSEEYKLKFMNGKLVEWNREHIYDFPPVDHSPNTTPATTSK